MQRSSHRLRFDTLPSTLNEREWYALLASANLRCFAIIVRKYMRCLLSDLYLGYDDLLISNPYDFAGPSSSSTS